MEERHTQRRQSVHPLQDHHHLNATTVKQTVAGGSRKAFTSFCVVLLLITGCGMVSLVMLGDALSAAEVVSHAAKAQKNFVRGYITPRPATTNSTVPVTGDIKGLTVRPTVSPVSPPKSSTKLAPIGGPAPPQRQPQQQSNAVVPASSAVTRGADFDVSVSRDQGIVLCLHNEALALGVSLLRELRCLGNNELVQIYHCFSHELSQASKETLFSVDNRIEIVDVCSDLVQSGAMKVEIAHKFSNWWIKPLALHHTDLTHVILLDADDLLLKDPATIRLSQGYVNTGTLFFYDRVVKCSLYLNKRVPGRPPTTYIKHILADFDYTGFNITGGKPNPSQRIQDSLIYQGKTCHEQDSSMVAIDKSRAGKALDVLWWLITRERFRFEFSWGDKESFWLAYELAQLPYAFSPWGVSVVSSSPNKDMRDHPDTLCGSIAQYSPVSDAEPELLYINGRALLDPIPQGVDNRKYQATIMHNTNPSHVTPRRPRADLTLAQTRTKYPAECLVGFGSVAMPLSFKKQLLWRRMVYEGVVLEVDSAMRMACHLF